MRKAGISFLLAMALVFSLIPVNYVSASLPSDGGSVSVDGDVAGRKFAVSEGRMFDNTVAAVRMAATCTDEATQFLYTVLDEKDGDSTYSVASITGYAGEETKMVIPTEVTYQGEKIRVKEIGDEAFKENQAITSVMIPEGIEVIGLRSFCGCESLEEVNIPASIVTWRSDRRNEFDGTLISEAFSGCTGLKKLTLAEGLTVLGAEAFENCSALQKVRIPSTVDLLPQSAFEGCTSLKDVEICEGIKSMGYRAFAECTSLTEITIPSTITAWHCSMTMGGEMNVKYDCTPFYNCTNLSKVVLSDGLTTLNNAALLQGCKSVKSVTIPSSVRDVQRAFYDCTYLEEINIEEGIEVIGNWAFMNCSSLKKMVLPNSVKTIYGNSFHNCVSLETLVVSEQLEQLVNGSPISNCPALKEVWFLCENMPYYANFLGSLRTEFYSIPGSKTWDVLKEVMAANNIEPNLKAIPSVEGISVQSYEGEYDKENHPLFQVSGLAEGDRVSYRQIAEDGTRGESLTEIPEAADAGTYQTEVIVRRYQEGETPSERYRISGIKANSVIQKKAPVIDLGNLVFYYQADWEIVPEKYEGEAELTYRYYKDRSLRKEIEGKPTEPGNYYVVAAAEESQNYQAGTSEPTKMVLTETEPTISPTEEPSATLNPFGEPGSSAEPNASGEPGSSAEPNPSGEPGSSAEPNPSGEPGSSATLNPSGEPGSSATLNPSGEPGSSATLNPSGEPGSSAEPNPSGEPGSSAEPNASGEPGSSAEPDPSGEPGSSATLNPSGEPGSSATLNPSGEPGSSAVPNPSGEPESSAASNDTAAPGSSDNPDTAGKDSEKSNTKKITVKKVTLKKVSSKKKRTITVQWKAVSGATGYQIVAGTNKKVTKGKKTVTVKNAKTVKATIRKLKSKKKYFVKVRAYKTVKGKKNYGSWSKVKSVKVK